MAEAGEQTDDLGTVYRVRYADGERSFFTEIDYQQERQDADAPQRVEAHRIVAADAYREARFEAHDGWWMLTGIDMDGRRVDLADTTEPELDTLALTPAIERQLGLPVSTAAEPWLAQESSRDATADQRSDDERESGEDPEPAGTSTLREQIRGLVEAARAVFTRDARDHGEELGR